MTVKQFFSATVFCLAAASTPVNGVELPLFPELDHYDSEEIRLHGLAALYPGRVLFEDPRLSLRTVSAPRDAARVETLPRDITYLRLYRLDEALAALNAQQAQPALIVDFRFLKSELAAVDILHVFAQHTCFSDLSTIGQVPDGLIAATPPPEHKPQQRRTPVIVLCNRETAGPFEVVLERLQRSGAIIAVGEPTAGHTGFYQKTNNYQAWTLIGEIRPDAETSLVGTGFQPRIQIQTSAEENYSSYHRYEAGTSLVRLLRAADQASIDADSKEVDATDMIGHDRVLQRGVDIVTALQVLQ
jgi:hypothetical protein